MSCPGEIVDLTGDSPLGGPQQGKRRRSPSPEAVVLEDDEPPQQQQEEEREQQQSRQHQQQQDDEQAVQRRQIMQFAAAKRARGPAAGDQQEPPPMPPQQPAGGDGEARQRIMAMAARVNAERGIAPAAASSAPDAASAAGTSDAQQPGAPNSLLTQLHAERMARQQARGGGGERQQGQGGDEQRPRQQHPPQRPALTILSYNLWFQEEVHIQARMAAVAAMVAEHRPDFLCFQEVTPAIRSLLASSPWWRDYDASPAPHQPYSTALLWRRASVAGARYAAVPFENSQMGRDVKAVTGRLGDATLTVATSHLESPTGWNQLWSEARVAQAKAGFAVLHRSPGDVLWLGDMNWGELADGQAPLPASWQDAWTALHPGDPGLTYDPKANPMLKPTNRIRRRLDRCWCRLRSWRLASIEMVGRHAIPGIKYEGRPVLPSDHFGLLVKLEPAAAT